MGPQQLFGALLQLVPPVLLHQLAYDFCVSSAVCHHLAKVLIRKQLEQTLDELRHFIGEWNPAELWEANCATIHVLNLVVQSAAVQVDRRTELLVLGRDELVIPFVRV